MPSRPTTARGPRARRVLARLVLALCIAGASLASVAGAKATIPSRSFADAARAHRCGSVRVKGTSYAVGVVAGHASCPTARYVIRYVLQHGPVTQGSPGRAPRGWSCGYGYGRTPEGQNVRGGPSCERGSTIVEGIEAKLRPYF